jgi:hypothetical protein
MFNVAITVLIKMVAFMVILLLVKFKAGICNFMATTNEKYLLINVIY